jgi:3-deoxy-manno-octulosonate cytidylyltransferase (CMP-KDO synthetase)
MNFIVVIPARYASSRFPGKPLEDLNGKPMIVHVAARAARSGAQEVIVATDHAGIAEAVKRHGYAAVMTRADHATGTDRIAEVVRTRRYADDQIIVNVQGDEPLIAPAAIRAVAQNLEVHANAQIATLCHALQSTKELINPNIVKVALDEGGYALYFSRAPIPFPRDAMLPNARSTRLPARFPGYRHIGLYAYRCSFLRQFSELKPVAIERFEALEQLRALAHGYRISVAITRAAPHPGVDTPADLARLRRYLRARRAK